MILNSKFLSENQKAFAERLGIKLGEDGFILKTVSSDCLFVERKDNDITIGYSRLCELYRGIALLKEGIADGEIKKQARQLETLSAFLDCSRNAVPKIEMLKNYVMDIAALGYNELYLYTEDTFEIKDYAYFGHWRGRYSAEEIKELDSFSKEFGIELIPAIQTLAHLNAAFHWKQFSEIRDTTDILLCGDERTYDFIDKMLSSIRSMYTTDKINIGMDEAHMLGLGKYLENNGYHDKIDIFLKHISRVMALVNKYGFKPIMWSDMFFKITCGKCNYDQLEIVDFRNEVLELIPENMSLAYWNYSPQTDEYYDSMFKAHIKMGRKIIFTGGFKKWVGFCPSLQFSFNASRMALNSAFKHGIKDVIITGWGDDGAEGSAYLMLPGLVLYAEKCYIDDMSDEAVDHRLKTVYGYSLKEYMVLEKPNILRDRDPEKIVLGANPNKVLLWNDPLLGQYDRHILKGTNEYYLEIFNELAELKNRNNRYSYVFETVSALCDVLSTKAELGVQLYEAYNKQEKEKLALLKSQTEILIGKLDVLHKTFRKNWLKENKIFGFDVQDIRFGALKSRLTYTSEVLEQYLNGEIESIAELEEKRLYIDCRDENSDAPLNGCHNIWTNLVTVNVL